MLQDALGQRADRNGVARVAGVDGQQSGRWPTNADLDQVGQILHVHEGSLLQAGSKHGQRLVAERLLNEGWQYKTSGAALARTHDIEGANDGGAQTLGTGDADHG